MKTSSGRFPRVWEPAIYGILAGLVIWLLTRGGLSLSPDSISYISLTRVFSAGQWSKMFVATWPPFFPLLIALVSSLGWHAEQSARIISVISYAGLVAAVFLLARATAGRLVAHLTSLSLLFFAPLLAIYSFCWSETVFLALIALSLLVLDKFYRSTDPKDTRYLVCGALLVALAFLTRYAGVALFFAGLAVIGFKAGLRSPTARVKALILYSVIACAPITLYLIGRLHYEGSGLPPANQVVTSLWQNLGLLFGTVYRDFLTFGLNLADYPVVWQPDFPTGWLSILTASIFLILGLLYVCMRSSRETIKAQLVPIVYVVCYAAFIVIISTFRYRTLIESRLSSSIYPFLILLMFSAVVLVCRRVKRRQIKLPLCVASVLAVLSFWLVQSGSFLNLYAAKVPSGEPAVEHRDLTGDDIVDVSDLIYLNNYLFRAGPRPRPLENANINCDGHIDIGDVIYLINYLYKDGPPPCTLED